MNPAARKKMKTKNLQKLLEVYTLQKTHDGIQNKNEQGHF